MLRYLALTLCFSSSLWVSLYVAYGGPYVIALTLKLAQDSLAFMQPQLLRLLLAYISYYQFIQPDPGFGPRESPIQGFALAFLMFAASILQTVTLNQVRAKLYLVPQGLTVAGSLVLPTLLRDRYACSRGSCDGNICEGTGAI